MFVLEEEETSEEEMSEEETSEEDSDKNLLYHQH